MQRVVLVVGLAFPVGCASAPTPVTPAGPVELAITGVRVFDGERVLQDQTVLVGGGKVVGLGRGMIVPRGAQVVAAPADATLLPGLVDAHAHVNLDDDPVDALAFGVATEIDMMSSPDVSVKLARDGSTAHARVVPTGFAATAPGGHGTEYGGEVPTLTKPEEAAAFVDARVKEGSHHLKIIIETGVEIGFTIPTLDTATVTALVAAAHAHHLLAVAHVGSAADVAVALAGGVDGLAHVPAEALDATTIATIAKRKMFVAPTLSVLASICHDAGGAALAADPRIAPILGPEAAANLDKTFPHFEHAKLACDAPAAITRALHDAGVPILAGTDAPNAGTAHGATVHDELARLVAAGLTPTAALVAATSAPARAYGIDAGSIRIGATADLVLVDGDPTRDITKTRAIRAVWRAGHAVDLAARRTAMATARAAAAKDAAAARTGLVGPIADFETGAVKARVGQIVASSDKLMGGTSTSEIAVIDGGADRTKHALKATGTVVFTKRGGFAGVSFLPAPTGFAPVDMTAVKRVTFWVRGDGKQYLLFASTMAALHAQPFEAGKDWTRVTIDLAKFDLPLDGIAALTWATNDPGPFALELDQIVLE